MLVLISLLFIILVISLSLMMSFELRAKLVEKLSALQPKTKRSLSKVRDFAHQMNQATGAEQTQQHWHLQQWWILIAGICLFSTIVLFSVTRTIDPTKVEADYLKEVDPQIYALLNGEILTPPPEVDNVLVNAAIVEAIQAESQQAGQTPFALPAPTTSLEELSDMNSHINTSMVDRKWDRINPRYKQRLLMVFKIMKERHNYELVLLEGYRSPARQNMLSGNRNTTRARAYQSYHQFGLAADVAFKRNGKVVITERDPWAMRGYELYGEVAESVGLTWGGRWKSIKDFGHTEYRMPGLRKTQEMAEQLTSEGQMSAQNIN